MAAKFGCHFYCLINIKIIYHNMINQNSFSDNIASLTDNVNIAIGALNAITDSIIGDDDVVNIELPNNESINILSNNNIINRLNNVENTVKAFTSGNGVVKLVDGTHRNVQVSTIAQAPQKIENLTNIDTFHINPNWFFEELMFPKLTIKCDLKDKVDDVADRVQVCRIILDISGDNNNYIKDFYNQNIIDKNLSYNELLNLLNYNNISYYKDIEILNFPLYQNEYFGKFIVTKSEIIEGNLYYYLDTIYLSNSNSSLNNVKLNIGDKLKYKQSVYEIVNINETYNRVDLKREIGLDSINVGESFEYYNEPFNEKIIEIPIGINEINCIFLKGINESYNLIADEWSNMISFITNDLKFNEDDITLEEYYMHYVSDFGRDMIAQIKDKRIFAYNGITPNPVVLNKNNFNVVKINTQINAALDIDDVKTTRSNIISLKSQIENLKHTISKKKSDMLSSDIIDTNLQKKINDDILQLNTLTTEYTSNVDYLNSQLKENAAVTTTPKYHIRGFFDIPEYQYTDSSNKIGKQEIIGFDIRYRYLKLNEVGTELSTFKYIDANGNSISAVYSDWNTYQSTIREKKYNPETGTFEWVNENPADGNEININQIDIPISNGEKVEFMVRSISEAGYPNNPLKSKWSNSIIMSFPDSLSGNDQLENILNDVKSESISIRLNDTLSAAGYYTHIEDEVISTDNTNIIYHHSSNNISYKDGSIYKSLYDKIIELEQQIKELQKQK